MNNPSISPFRILISDEILSVSHLTDDDIQELARELLREQHRRKGEKKLPMYVVGHKSMKRLPDALSHLQNQCVEALGNSRSPEVYFGDKVIGGVDQTLLELRVEFWSKSEYDARPDVVFG